MKIILSDQCESFTGSLGKGFGYFIVRRKNGFYTVRSKHNIPEDGHWRFILACMQIAKNKLYFSDIQVSWLELHDALYEAHHFVAAQHVRANFNNANKSHYNATDILNLKITFGL